MNESLIPGGSEPEMRFFYVFLGISLKKEWISVTMYKFFLIESEMCNRSLMDRTPDSDSGNAGSIPAGCIYMEMTARICRLSWNIGYALTEHVLSDGTAALADVRADDAELQQDSGYDLRKVRWIIDGKFQVESYRESEYRYEEYNGFRYSSFKRGG